RTGRRQGPDRISIRAAGYDGIRRDAEVPGARAAVDRDTVVARGLGRSADDLDVARGKGEDRRTARPRAEGVRAGDLDTAGAGDADHRVAGELARHAGILDPRGAGIDRYVAASRVAENADAAGAGGGHVAGGDRHVALAAAGDDRHGILAGEIDLVG